MDSRSEPRSTDATPPDLLPLIRRSGVLSARQLEEVSSKIGSGEYPGDSRALAARLVEERILTEFQAGRLLRKKVHGLVVGRYVILDRLGAGAKGRVFKAQHRLMGRVVALKVIAPQIASRASSIARFYREMRLIGRLDHPNVVRAFDADQIGDLLYIVMEYVPGKSLDRVLAARGSLSAAEVLDYMAQAARGLGHAHDRGIIHRDIKPSNLLLTDEGQIKVLDLGLSALMEADHKASFATAAGLIVGTLHYMSPEQSTALEIDGRSDLFSLGCTMYYLLSGQMPFPGDTVAECIARRIRGDSLPITTLRPDLSPRIVQVLAKLLARLPEDRFQTGAAAAVALEEAARYSACGSTPPEPASRPDLERSVSELDATSMPRKAVYLPSTQAWAPPVRLVSSWSRVVSIAAARPSLTALLILVFEVIVFAIGFALGHATMTPQRWRGN